LPERHWRYYLTLPEHLALAHRCADIENMVVACRAAIAARDDAVAVRGLGLVWSVLKVRGPVSVAIELVGSAARLPGLSDRELGVIDWVEGSVLLVLGKLQDAARLFDRGLVRSRVGGDSRTEILLLCAKAEQLMIYGDDGRAMSFLESARALLQEVSDVRMEIKILNITGNLYRFLGDFERAQLTYSSAIDISRSIGDEQWEGGLLGNLGCIHLEAGSFVLARGCLENALRCTEAHGVRQWEANTRCNLGLVLYELGEMQAASGEFLAALGIAREIGSLFLQAVLQINLGFVSEVESGTEQAKRWYQVAVDSAKAVGSDQLEAQALSYLGYVNARLGHYASAVSGFERVHAILEAGTDTATAAISTAQEARVHWVLGQYDLARQAAQKVEEILCRMPYRPSTEVTHVIDAMKATLCHVLTEQA
jgi:tetratricopeptide (TPR) repeat protein